MPTRQYRCIVDRLNIRTQPSLANQFRTDLSIARHELVNANDERRTEAEGYLWVQHDRGWSAERSLDGRSIFLTDAVRPRDRMWGINIDPNNPRANPPAERLLGTGWVRFVFHVDSRRETLDQSFAFYDPVIRAFSRAGTQIILILLHDTYVGNIPWLRGDWQSYARGFAERAGLIARHYRGQVAVYQIWNEPDVTGAPTSIPVTAGDYATILAESAITIAQGDPAARVITAGLASDLENAINYLLDVRRTLDGRLPADGIGFHPYGHTPPNYSPFDGWSRGTLDNFLRRVTGAFPRFPIYITEIGVPRVDVTNREFWPRIGTYMDRTIDFLRDTCAYAVRAVTWFAWSDTQDQAGIVTADDQPKGDIYAQFFNNVHADYPTVIVPLITPFDGRIGLTHAAGETLPDRSVSALAGRLGEAADNADALLVKATRGTGWSGGSEQGLSLAGPAELTAWAAAFARSRAQLHAWHEVQGSNSGGEISLIGQLTRTAGVLSVVIDLNPTTLALRNGTEIRAFMLALRHSLPAGYPLGLSFEGRPEAFSAVNGPEWYPYIDNWQPRFVAQGAGGQNVTAQMGAMYTAMRAYRKPIVPILQITDPVQMRLAVRFATENQGSPAVMFGPIAQLSDEAFAAIRGLSIPWTAGMVPARNLGTAIVRTGRALSVRATPSESAVVLSQLRPGESVTVLERRMTTPLEWVRHRRGWSVARNTSTGEVSLS